MRLRASSPHTVVVLALIAIGALAATQALAVFPTPRPQLVSRGSGRRGLPSPAAHSGSVDGSGRHVAFYSAAFEGRRAGIFLRDLGRQRTRRLSDGSGPVLAASGDRVAFQLDGKVYALDLQSGRRVLVSAPRRAHGGPVGGISGEEAISGTGRYVAFSSTSAGLMRPPGTRGSLQRGQIYVRDLKRKRTTLVSRAGGPDGAIGEGESREPSIARDGRFVAFTSEARNLTPPVPAGRAVYVRNLRTGALRLVSGEATHPSISADGASIAYELGRFGRPETIAVRSLKNGTVVQPTHFGASPIRVPPDAEPTLSADGRFLAFRGGVERGGLQKLFLADLRTHRLRSVGEVGIEGETSLSFSAKGEFLTFDTYVQNVPGRESGEPVTESGEVFRLRNPLLRSTGSRGSALTAMRDAAQ